MVGTFQVIEATSLCSLSMMRPVLFPHYQSCSVVFSLSHADFP